MRILLWTLLSLLSISASAADNKVINTTAQDPIVLCSVLRNKLPNSLSSIRKLGILHNEKTTPDIDHCEDQEPNCSVHRLEFAGLDLLILEDRKSSEMSALNADISDTRWRLFGDIFVGQKIEVLEQRFGVKVPRDVSPVVLNGECTPLTVWHSNGKLLRLELDCQACI